MITLTVMEEVGVNQPLSRDNKTVFDQNSPMMLVVRGTTLLQRGIKRLTYAHVLFKNYYAFHMKCPLMMQKQLQQGKPK